MNNPKTMLDKFDGTIFGMAVGDAVGTTLEFKHRGTFEPISDMIGGGPFNLKAGEWTDDTSMALCMLDSLIRNGLDPKGQLDNYLKWFHYGFMSSNGECFDIGNTTKEALRNYQISGDPIAKNNNPESSGNGSIMRLAPVVLYSINSTETEIMENASISSKTTHASLTCVDACRYLAMIICKLINGASKEEALEKPKYTFCPEIETVANGSFKSKKDIRGTGYAVDTLEAALWGFYNSNDFRTGLLNVVNLGDDADSTGAVYGQIAGAFYGFNGIPNEWIKKIAKKEEIRKMVHDLFDTVH